MDIMTPYETLIIRLRGKNGTNGVFGQKKRHSTAKTHLTKQQHPFLVVVVVVVVVRVAAAD